MKLTGEAQAVATGGHSYNEVLPLMLARYCGPGLAGPGHHGADRRLHVRHGRQRERLRHGLDLRHLSRLHPEGRHRRATTWRWAAGARSSACWSSIGTAYLVMQFLSIMDYVQALFSFFIAPLFGTVLLGMLWKRATPAGRLLGPAGGHLRRRSRMWAWVKVDPAALRYIALSPNAKDMAENMYRALWSWMICVRRHGGGEPGDAAQAGERAVGPGLRLHGDPQREPSAALPAPDLLGRRRGRGLRYTSSYFLVGDPVSEHKHFISIWLFIGGLLLIYGILILGSGIYDYFNPARDNDGACGTCTRRSGGARCCWSWASSIAGTSGRASRSSLGKRH